MKRVLLVPSSDYLGHPFPQRHNQIFERLHDGEGFEVHVVRFRLFDGPRLSTRVVVHELDDVQVRSAADKHQSINEAYRVLRKIIQREYLGIE